MGHSSGRRPVNCPAATSQDGAPGASPPALIRQVVPARDAAGVPAAGSVPGSPPARAGQARGRAAREGAADRDRLAAAVPRRDAAGTGHAGGEAAGRGRYRAEPAVDWPDLIARLAPLRWQWDLAVLANLAAGAERPKDLIAAINSQAADGRPLSWKVLNDTLNRLRDGGYIARHPVPHVPRETRYRLRPAGLRLITAVRLLGDWYRGQEPGDGARLMAGPPGALAPRGPPHRAVTRRGARAAVS